MKLLNNIFLSNEDRNFGFFYENNQIKFYLPDQLFTNENHNNFNKLQKYNSVLLKYASSTKKTIGENGETNDLETISSYLNLLDDFFSNGSFHLMESLYNHSQNKIKWNKTIRSNDIVFSKNNIIYNSFISTENKKNIHHQYYLLYCEAMRRAQLLFLNVKNDEQEYLTNKSEQNYYICKYLDEHFKDREVYIAKNLQNIFINEIGKKYSKGIFEVKFFLKFEHIWQEMITSVLNIYNYNVVINSGKYIKSNNIGISLYQDHFLKYKNRYFLLDSKFYKSYNNGEYPQTESIGKQFLYRYLIAKQENIPIEEINSSFIFPKNNPLNRLPEVFDIHKLKDEKNMTIYCVAVDLENIITLYLKNSVDYELLETLENCIILDT